MISKVPGNDRKMAICHFRVVGARLNPSVLRFLSPRAVKTTDSRVLFVLVEATKT